jgi:polysaccharidase protein
MKRLPYIFAALFAPSAVGAVFYVDSADGSDTQSGTTPSTAFSTLAHASSIALSPGDYVLLKRGDVWHEPLALNYSGAPDLPITIGAYGTSGGGPVIDGSSFAKAADLVSFTGKTDIVIDGLQLRNAPLNGLNINNCSRIWLRNFTIAVTRQFGMLVYNCNSVTVENSEITGVSGDTTAAYDGIRFDGSGGELSGFIIRGCYIHNNVGGEGWNSSNGIFIGHTGGVNPILRGVQITANELSYNGNFDQNQAGRGLTGTFTGDITVINNYVHDNASAGIYLGDEGVNVAITIAQNIFYNNALRQFGGYTTTSARAYHNAVFVDNAALTAMGAEVGGTGTWQILNNSFYYQTPSTNTFRGFITINDAAQDSNLTSDCNLFYSPTPDRWRRSNDLILTFPQWMGYGFDLHSVNPY